MTITATRINESMSRRSRRGWIGIDIGTSTLKLAQVERRAGRWRLVYGQIIPISPGAVASPEGLRQTLAATLRGSWGWPARPAATVLPWASSTFQTTELPPTRDDELEQLMAARYAGSETSPAAHWRAESRQVAAQPSAVHTTSIPAEFASNAVEALYDARLDCRAMDARPFALARAVSLSSTLEPQRAVAAIDWGYQQVSVVLVRHGRPYFTRLLRDEGLRLLLDSIQAGLKLSHEEARVLLPKLTLQARPDSQSRNVMTTLRDLTRESIEHTVSELKRTLTFAAQTDAELDAGQVVLFGGGATICGMNQHLTKELGVPTKTFCLDANSVDDESSPAAMLGEAIALSAIPMYS